MKKEVETLPPSRLKGSTAQHRKKTSLKKEVAKRWMINRGRVSNEALQWWPRAQQQTITIMANNERVRWYLVNQVSWVQCCAEGNPDHPLLGQLQCTSATSITVSAYTVGGGDHNNCKEKGWTGANVSNCSRFAVLVAGSPDLQYTRYWSWSWSWNSNMLFTYGRSLSSPLSPSPSPSYEVPTNETYIIRAVPRYQQYFLQGIPRYVPGQPKGQYVKQFPPHIGSNVKSNIFLPPLSNSEAVYAAVAAAAQQTATTVPAVHGAIDVAAAGTNVPGRWPAMLDTAGGSTTPLWLRRGHRGRQSTTRRRPSPIAGFFMAVVINDDHHPHTDLTTGTYERGTVNPLVLALVVAAGDPAYFRRDSSSFSKRRPAGEQDP
ncbi:hypothetical protein KCU88_g146, partial [Aureobasidium melanogenum]